MAKPKGKDIVGWGSFGGTSVTILSERDVNQSKNRKRGLGATFSHGHYVRQIGLARREQPGYGGHPDAVTYHIYTHSQVTNAGGYREPPAYVGMTREDMEWLWMEMGKELFSDKPEV
jgi:hypothetical protein